MPKTIALVAFSYFLPSVPFYSFQYSEIPDGVILVELLHDRQVSGG